MITILFGNNLRRVIFLLMVGVFFSMAGAFAAPPVNDTCDSALFVTPGVAISGQTLNIEATFAPDDPELSCTMGPGFGSVFFEFVATETSARIRTDVDSVDLDSDFAVYAVDQINWCDKSLWTEVGCSEDGAFEFNGDICIEGLTVGYTYKIMLVSFTEGSSGDYTLQIDSPCQGQASGDADSDGVPDASDVCPGFDDNVDTDSDSIPDGCDVCDGFDDTIDSDLDGIPDGCDICEGFDDTVDSDGDGVADGCDECAGSDDTVDTDNDGIPDGCDTTPNGDDDNDGVDNAADQCPATPAGEAVDTNGCSATQLDDDGDGVSNAVDQCPGFDDNADADGDGIPDGCDTQDTIAPVVSNTTANPNPVEVDTEVTLTAQVDDLDSNIQYAQYNIDGGTWSDPYYPSGTSNSETISMNIYSVSEPVVLTVCVRGTDDAGNISDEECIYLPVYDPSAGFVTGGGWIDSPEGAYIDDPSATGKANFGFVAKYKKGATEPDGNTEFQFKAGDLDFHSDTYEWLVVTGSNYAKFKGSGTINGSGSYKFMIWAGDSSPYTFRIKIWEEDEDENEFVTYDNGFDQAIGGGSIVIHEDNGNGNGK